MAEKSVRSELMQAANDLRRGDVSLGGWSCLEQPIAEWLEVTAGRVGGKTWSGSNKALGVARLINGRAR